MEISEHDLLEELLALRRDNWDPMNPSCPTEMEGLFSSGWNYDCLDQEDPSSSALFPSYFCQGLSSSPFAQLQDFNNCYFNNSTFAGKEYSVPQFTEELSAPQFTDSSYNTLDTLPFPVQEDTPMSILQDEDQPSVFPSEGQNLEGLEGPCKAEPIQSPEVPASNFGACSERKARGKRLEGQPSKNLMAERRRRKRLNDRLSMLRSIVPKISKMDRTSILGDTIDYMKELLERINNLQQEIEVGSEHLDTVTRTFKESRADEIVVKNTPKFDVERRNEDTRIEISCQAKPGLLLSTVNTLEALGLEIQQCVISCFNDFAMQASCSEELDRGTTMCSEDIKQALFRSAGYGGRCM